jgi:hypothetical protein
VDGALGVAGEARIVRHQSDDGTFLAQLSRVFTLDLIDAWIACKRQNEVDSMRLRPHSYEFQLYYDAYAGVAGGGVGDRGRRRNRPTA